MKNNYIVILLFCILFNLLNFNLVKSQTTQTGYFQWTTNGHWYTRVTETADVGNSDAVLKCNALEYPASSGNKGYLTTILSSEEWQFLIASNLTSASSWISGTDYDKLGSWVYNTGPENGFPLYNLYFDKCYQFCVFGAIEPNLLVNEHWLHSSSDGVNQYWNNNNNNATNIKSYICEFGGMSDPIIQTKSTVGGDITISNLSGYDLASLTVTFTSRSDASSFQCTGKTIITTTSITCTLPANTGKYNVKLIDKNSKTITLNWQYDAPFISAVYPNYNINEKITVTGSGFGAVASKIVVSVTAGNVACNTVALIKTDEAITCILSATLTDKFLPLTINVNGQGYSSYKTAFYYAPASLFYSGFVSSSSFTLTKDGYAGALKLDGYTGSLAMISDSTFYNFVNKTLPKPFGSGLWNLWQPYYYETGQYKLVSGVPNAGTVVTPYSATAISLTGVTVDSRFWLSLVTGSVTINAATTGGATLAQYGGIRPQFTNVTTHSIPTTGGKAYLQIDNYGTVFSNIVLSLTVQSATINPTFTRDYINSYIIADIPAGYNGPYSISVSVDSYVTSNAQYIDYIRPGITSISKPSTSGGAVVIIGTNYYNTIGLVSIQGLTCTDLSMVTTQTQLQCTVPAGSGNVNTQITVGTKVSDTYIFQYADPIVSSVSTISPNGGIITIQGQNLNSDASLIQVSIGSFGSCTNVQVETAHTTITCQAPSGYNRAAVTVTVNTLVSNNDINLLYNSPTITNVVQVQDYLVITGTNYGLLLNGLSVFIGDIDITSYCLSSATDIKFTCQNLPTTVSSGTLLINGGISSPSFAVELAPYLVSLSKTNIKTSGETITIQGRYFENSLVFVSSIVATANKISSELFTVTIPSGTGRSRLVGMANENGLVPSLNTLSFSYISPSITSVQQNLKVITITGSDFGNTISNISVNIGSVSISSSSISISTPHTVLQVTLPDSLKNAALSVSVDGQSVSLSSFKLKPYITESTLPSPAGGILTIQGYFISQTNQASQNTSVQFKMNNNNVVCTYLAGPSPFSYECTIASGSAYIDSIVIVDSISSDSFRFYYNAPTITKVSQVNDGIAIEGNDFGTNFNGLTITIESIITGCTSNNTYGQCLTLPTNVVSGNFVLNGMYNPGSITPSYTIQFRPYLISLQTTTLPTNGSTISLTGRFFESFIQVNLNSNLISFTKTSNQVLQIDIPAGTGINKEISVSNNNGNTPSFNSLSMSYVGPSITSVQQNLKVITITGSNFGNTISKISVNIGSVSISSSSISISTPHTELQVTLPDSLKNAALSVSVDGQNVSLSSFKSKPYISESTSPSVDGGKLTIQGYFISQTNQASQNTNVQFKMNNSNVVCTYLAGPSPFSYECTIASGFGFIDSTVIVDSITSDNYRFYYASPIILNVIQVEDYLEIQGEEFGTNFNGLTINIGNVDITSTCSGTNTFGTCINLPLEVKSGNVSLSGGHSISQPYELIFKPFLKQINPKSVNTQGGEITIMGRFFENPDILYVVDSSKVVEQQNITVTDNTTIIFTSLPNTGIDHPIQVLINSSSDRLSNTLYYSNNNPTITEINYLVENDTLEIIGTNFGTDTTKVSFSVGSLNLQTIDHTRIIATLSDNAVNSNLYVLVSGLKSNSLPYYLTPLIKSSTPIGVDGGSITVSGKYLSDKDSNSNLIGLIYQITKNDNIVNITCEYKSQTSNSVCQVPSSVVTGTFKLQTRYQTFESNVYPMTTISPSVSSSSNSIKGKSSTITIKGNNFANVNLVVIIGNNKLENTSCTEPKSLSSSTISCQFSSNISTVTENGFEYPLTIHVTVDELSGSGDVFNYQIENKKCSSTCIQPYGTCVNGECICSDKYTGIDCQTLKEDTEQPEKPNVNDNSTSTLPGKDIQFDIAITHLRELNFDNTEIKTLRMSDIYWGEPIKSSDKSYFKGTFKDDPATVQLTVTYFTAPNTIQFAGENMNMPANSIKYEIQVSNWDFSSQVSSLQVIYKSSSPKSVEYECEEIETTTNIDNSNEDSIGWFEITNGANVLSAKFSDKMIVDNRILNARVKSLNQNDVLYTEVNLKESDKLHLLVSMNTPFFSDNVILDPNFTALIITTKEATKCSDGSNWKIPLIVVLCSAGGVAAAIGSFLIYRKYKQNQLMKDVKLKSLRSLN